MADKDRANIPSVETDADLCSQGKEGLAESREDKARREARRRILAGGLGGAPFILTLASRPALASHCSPSGMASGNMSRVHDVLCAGRTPGFWKTHEQMCEKYIMVGPCNPIGEDNGQCDDYSVPTEEALQAYIDQLKSSGQMKYKNKIEKAEAYLSNLQTYPGLDSPPFGTPFSAIFGSGYTTEPKTTIMQALWLDDSPPGPPVGAGGPSPVLAHSAAAWLNAKEFGIEAYGLSPQQVIDMVQSMILTDPYGLKDTLEMLNQHTTS